MRDGCVKRITLNTDASGGTIEDTADDIDVSIMKIDTITKRIRLTRQHGDTGGGGTGDSIINGLQIRDRIHTLSEYLPNTCSNHGMNIILRVPTIQYFGKGGLEKRNVLQYLHSLWNLTQQYEWE